MTIALKSPVPIFPQSGVEQLKNQTSSTLEGEKTRLRKATREFEAFFTYYMLKTMRETIPENSLSENTPFKDGLGKETFTQMIDMEVARDMAGSSRRSIADLLYDSMVKLVTAEFNAEESPSPTGILHTPKQEAIPLNREALPVNLKNDPLPLPERDPSSYRLEPRNEASRENPIRSSYGALIDEAARANNLDSSLIESVILAESGGNPDAISPAGAKGLMQLMDTTASDYGVTDSFDPGQNILAGSRFLRRLMDRFGDTRLALAAYNAGPENVSRYGDVPPYPETRKYVEKVTHFLKAASHIRSETPKVTHTKPDNDSTGL
jgi:Rod binding domain-containing protein